MLWSLNWFITIYTSTDERIANLDNPILLLTYGLELTSTTFGFHFSLVTKRNFNGAFKSSFASIQTTQKYDIVH